MKNFTYKALAVATAAVCGAGAQAGSVSSTTAKYAIEAITASTAITLSPVVYTMGVGRVVSQPFTIIVREPAGATTTLACGPVPVLAGNGAASITVKRTSSNECVYDVNVTTNVTVNDTITFSGLSINAHSLATVGATEKLNVALYDTGETARVDNSNDVTATVATSGRAVSLTAATDNLTKADVNFNSGNSPLFGFVVANDDLALNATASFNIAVDGSFLDSTGTAVRANSILTNVAVTVAGDFSNVVTSFSGANNSSVVVAGNAGVNAGVIVPAVSYNNAAGTAVFTLAGTDLNPTGNSVVKVSLQSKNTGSLGTARVFGVSAVANPSTTGVAAQPLAGNASWWVWGANGIELRSAFFNNDDTNGNLTRFFFQNTGSQTADYSAVCQAEPGVNITYGTAKSGKLNVGTTAMNAVDVCTFDGGKRRGSITFTINANIGSIKGVYQQAINGAAAAYIPLDRPYSANTY